jgi:hypothetical protein
MVDNESELNMVLKSVGGDMDDTTFMFTDFNASLDILWDSHEILETFKRDLITLNQPNTS